MSNAGHHHTLRQSRTRQREASLEASQAHHAAMQRIREGNADVGRTHAEDFTAADDIGEQVETAKSEDLLEFLDTEISLNDADDLPETLSPPQPSPRGLDGTYVIRCFNDRAVFQPPSWSLGRLPQNVSLEHSKRWRVCTHIADWLTQCHRRFLDQPSYFSFWEPDELTDGPDLPPVTCEGLFQATGCQGFCDPTTFNRHVRETTLVWETRHLPIADLFSRECRVAWCASGVIARRQKYPFSEALLPNVIQSPRSGSSEGRRLLAMRRSSDLLPPVKYIQLICLMADVAWSDVAARHGKQVFREVQ